MILETKRLLLREMKPDDFQALFLVLGDPETMWHYPYTFDGQHVKDWIERNMNRYRKDGFGLWAVCLKETGELIGDCGLTLQNINGEILPEIGYHIRRDCQRKGYAGEAAKAVRDWAFRNTDYSTLYSYYKYTNTFVKTKANALTSEAFADFIRSKDIREFFITGADATACVKSTCFNMTKAGYAVHVISDCVTSYDLKKLPEMLAYYSDKGCEVRTLEAYRKHD